MASCRVYKHQHLALPKMFSEVLGVTAATRVQGAETMLFYLLQESCYFVSWEFSLEFWNGNDRSVERYHLLTLLIETSYHQLARKKKLQEAEALQKQKRNYQCVSLSRDRHVSPDKCDQAEQT